MSGHALQLLRDPRLKAIAPATPDNMARLAAEQKKAAAAGVQIRMQGTHEVIGFTKPEAVAAPIDLSFFPKKVGE